MSGLVISFVYNRVKCFSFCQGYWERDLSLQWCNNFLPVFLSLSYHGFTLQSMLDHSPKFQYFVALHESHVFSVVCFIWSLRVRGRLANVPQNCQLVERISLGRFSFSFDVAAASSSFACCLLSTDENMGVVCPVIAASTQSHTSCWPVSCEPFSQPSSRLMCRHSVPVLLEPQFISINRSALSQRRPKLPQLLRAALCLSLRCHFLSSNQHESMVHC